MRGWLHYFVPVEEGTPIWDWLKFHLFKNSFQDIFSYNIKTSRPLFVYTKMLQTFFTMNNYEYCSWVCLLRLPYWHVKQNRIFVHSEEKAKNKNAKQKDRKNENTSLSHCSKSHSWKENIIHHFGWLWLIRKWKRKLYLIHAQFPLNSISRK